MQFLSSEINGIKLIDRLEMAFKVPPVKHNGVIVLNTDDFRGVDFGFRDAVYITDELCFPSLLKYTAALELTELFELLGQHPKSEMYKNIAKNLPKNISTIYGLVITGKVLNLALHQNATIQNRHRMRFILQQLLVLLLCLTGNESIIKNKNQ
jgi:hypothetical protein